MPRRMAQHRHPQSPRLGDKGRRTHQIAQPQPRKDRLGKRPRMNHPPLAVQRFERGRGGGQIGHLEIIVILDHHEIAARRLFQQGQAAGQRHGGIGRAVVAGGGKDHIHRVRQPVGRQAIGIDIHRQHRATDLLQNGPQAGINRVFHQRAASPPQQNRGSQPKPVLRAHGDQNLICAGRNPAPGQDVAQDVFDQQRVVAFLPVIGKRLEVAFAQRAHRAKPPVLMVKQRGIRLAVDEGKGKAAPI